MNLGYQERQTMLALNGFGYLHAKIRVMDGEREALRQIAGSHGKSVSEWIEEVVIDAALREQREIDDLIGEIGASLPEEAR